MPATVGVYLDPLVERCDPESSDLVRDVVATLRRSGIETIDFDFGIELTDLEEAHKTVMAYESARSYATEWMQHRDRLSAPLQALLQEGWNCPHGRYAAELKRSRDARRNFAEAFDGIDLLLTPSAPGVAPAGLDTIGDPICSRPWSLIGAATLTMPAGLGSSGLPLGVQFVVPRGGDDELLRRCLALESTLPSPRWPVGAIGHEQAHDKE
jgi:Asp-tRNA(Asn)/Glu-tRNA(Gln) amidotransferase A subunit family amidase